MKPKYIIVVLILLLSINNVSAVPITVKYNGGGVQMWSELKK